MPTTLKFFRRNLPHWLVADRSFFITLRLHGTLPREIVKQLCEEREQLSNSNPDTAAVLDLKRQHFKKLERILDSTDEKNDWLAVEGYFGRGKILTIGFVIEANLRVRSDTYLTIP